MNKLFIILLPAGMDRDEVIKHLNNQNAISFWFYHFPYSFYVRSNLTAKQLQDTITYKFPTEKILIIRIDPNVHYSGLVPDNHVDFFKNT